MTAKIIVQPFKKYSPDYNDNSIRIAQEEYGLTDNEATLIRKFMDNKKGMNLTEGTKRMQFSKLSNIRKHLRIEYTEASIQDLKDYCDTIAGFNTPNTVNLTKSVLKDFYGYLIKQKLTSITRDELDEIKKANKVKSKVTEASLLTKTDITSMLNATGNPMHKALIALLAESGARIHEVATITWSQLKFDQHGAVFSLWSEKSQSYRYVRLRDSVPYLSAWKSLYQGYRDDAPVFVTERGNTLIYETCRATIARIAKKAGIKKKVNPHLFRHTRVTELLKLGMHEPELKKSIWGDVSTRMLANYEHLAGGNIDAEYMRVYGIDAEQKKPETMLSSVQCKNCHTINDEWTQFCKTCGLPMSEQARAKKTAIESFIDQESEDYKEFQRFKKFKRMERERS